MKAATYGQRAKRAPPLYEVLCKRQDGALRLFQQYHELTIADKVAERLRSVGCSCVVREARAR